MSTHPFTLFEGHVIADLDGLPVLIDTGSPVTFGRYGSIRLGGASYPVQPFGMGHDIEAIAELVGQPLAALIGADCLQYHHMVIDADRRELTVHYGPVDRDDPLVREATAYRPMMGVPVTPIEVGGRSLEALIDTGAKISYLAGEWPSDATPQGVSQDFYPGMGRFEVETFETDVTFLGTSVRAEFASPPAFVQAMLDMAGVDAIIGTELLLRQPLYLDYPNRVIAWLPQGWRPTRATGHNRPSQD